MAHGLVQSDEKTGVAPVHTHVRGSHRSGSVARSSGVRRRRSRNGRGVVASEESQIILQLREDIETGKSREKKLELENANLKLELESRDKAICRLERKIEKLKQEVDSFKKKEHGVNSEHLKQDADGTDQGGLESGKDDSAGSRRRRGRGSRPKSFDRKWRRRAVVLDAHCNCPDCGGELKELPPSVTEKLKLIPVQYFVEVIIRRKRVCKKCRKLYESSPPECFFNKSRLSNEVVAEFAIGRYLHHRPLYQMMRHFWMEVTDISLGTVLDHLEKLALGMKVLQDMLLEEIRGAQRLFADDTYLPIKGSEKSGKLLPGHVWHFVKDDGSFGGTDPIIAFLKSSCNWKSDTPAEILEDFDGILQTDAYRGWLKLEKEGKFKLALCWVHARRCFFKRFEFLERNGGGQPGELELLSGILDLFKRLFKVEESLDRSSPEEIVRQRQKLSNPLVDSLKELLDTNRANWEDDSEIAKAMDYMLKKWRHFNGFLTDGMMAIDNNTVERVIRHLAKGRKSWNHAGSPEWAEYACIFHTMLETAQLN